MKQYINLLKNLYLNMPSPLSVSVNLTNKCNQHCIYCEVGPGLVKTEKPLLVIDDLKWIIDEMNRSGIGWHQGDVLWGGWDFVIGGCERARVDRWRIGNTALAG